MDNKEFSKELEKRTRKFRVYIIGLSGNFSMYSKIDKTHKYGYT